MSTRRRTGTSPSLPLDAPPQLSAPEILGQQISIDGHLDEPAWTKAAVVTEFVQWMPAAGGPYAGSTEARVWYDAERLYIGFTCAQPVPVRSHVMPREDIDDDDQVGVILDTFHDRRSSYDFWVNAVGVQQDFRDTLKGDPIFAWDTVWQSKGVHTAEGYTVEIAIPWKSLRYPRLPLQDWGIILTRKVASTNAYYAWPALDPNQANLYLQAATLSGVTPPQHQSLLELMPTLTTSRQWERTDLSQPLAYDAPQTWTDYVSPGLDLRYGPTPDLWLDAAINPDFSQVEADPFLLDLNTRYALYLDERRPFFLSGSDAYDDPQETLYTRSITAPLWGAKLTGRVGKTQLGILNALDLQPQASLVAERDTPGFDAEDVEGRRALDSVVRVQEDLGEQFQAGMLYAEKDLLDADGGALHSWNRVGGLDVNGTFAKRYTMYAQVLGSITADQGDAARSGDAIQAQISREGSAGYGGFLKLASRSADFRAETAFQTRTGLDKLDLYQRYRFQPGWVDWVQPAVSAAISVDPSSDDPPDHWLGFETTGQIRGNTYVELGAGHQQEVYEHIPFAGFYGWVYGEGQPAGWLSMTGGVEGGEAVDYDAVAPAQSLQVYGTCKLRPLPPLQVALDLHHQTLWDANGSVSAFANIWRLETNVQFTRPIGLRGLVQWRDDERTLQLSGLLSWLPSPGTAAYLGYSQDVSAPKGEAAGALGRTVFAKLSWLFRP